MDEALRALIRKLDKSMCNGELVVDFELDKKVKRIVAQWLQRRMPRELRTVAEGEGTVYLVSDKEVIDLLDAKPMKVKRFE
jgi:chemotaxis response regulator CheB